MKSLVINANISYLEIKPQTSANVEDWKAVHQTLNSYTHGGMTKKFFFNLSDNTTFDKATKEYIQQELIPALFEQGLKKGAFVLPQNYFEQLDWQNMLNTLRKKNGSFLVRIFNEEESARMWVNN